MEDFNNLPLCLLCVYLSSYCDSCLNRGANGILHLPRLIQPSHKREKIIVWRYFIDDLFPAALASMEDHVALVLAVIDPDRHHETATFRESIPGKIPIEVLGREAVRTMIARRAIGMERDVTTARLAHERLIAHDKHSG